MQVYDLRRAKRAIESLERRLDNAHEADPSEVEDLLWTFYDAAREPQSILWATKEAGPCALGPARELACRWLAAASAYNVMARPVGLRLLKAYVDGEWVPVDKHYAPRAFCECEPFDDDGY